MSTESKAITTVAAVIALVGALSSARHAWRTSDQRSEYIGAACITFAAAALALVAVWTA